MDIKQLRGKSLSSMNTQELKDFISKAESKGFEISKSKELSKAVNLLKVKEPSKYGKEQVQSAKESLTVASEVPTLQKLGITDIPDWKKQEQTQKDLSKGLSGQPSLSGGQSINMGTPTDQGLPTYTESTELNTLESEYNQKKEAFDRAATDINDNPFFSEATRVGKQAKLDQQKARELTTLVDRITQIKADDQLKYNIAMDRYKLQQAQVEQNIQRLNMYINTGALLNATAKDLAQIGTSTGISQSMLQGIINRTRADLAAKNAPSMGVEFITNEQTGEVQVISYNKSTGQITGTNSLGQVKGAKILNDYEKDVENGRERLRKGEPWGNVWNTIYNKYKTNSILGTPEEIALSLDNRLGAGVNPNADLTKEFGWNKAGAYEQYIKTQTQAKPSKSDDLVFPEEYKR